MEPTPRRRRRTASGASVPSRKGVSAMLAGSGRRMSQRRRALLTVAITSGFLFSGVCGGVAYYLPALRAARDATGQTITVPTTSPPAGQTDRPVASSNDPFTVLLLGSDNDAKFSGDHLLTQSMILVRVDPASHHVIMLSIPRDLYVPISTGGTAKIDTAYADGGAATAVATVERDFHVHVDHYVWIGLRGLVNLIDELGGIDVVTTNPVVDDFYPGDLAGGDLYAYERVAVLPGAQHLDGLHAMEYVRSRHGDIREDFGRSERQQEVLVALRAKAKRLNALDVPAIAGSLNGEILTDLTIGQVGGLLPIAGGVDPSQIEHVLLLPPYTSGETVGGQDVLIPHWGLILPLVAKSFPS